MTSIVDRGKKVRAKPMYAKSYTEVLIRENGCSGKVGALVGLRKRVWSVCVCVRVCVCVLALVCEEAMRKISKLTGPTPCVLAEIWKTSCEAAGACKRGEK